MARRKKPRLTEVELEFMKVIWEKGEVTPDDIQDILRSVYYPLTGGSIRNVLAIMIENGYVTRKKHGKTHLYSAKVDKAPGSQHMALDLLGQVFGDSESLMIAALLKNRDVNPKELDKIKTIINHKKTE